jgi:hypothetical protein
MLPMLVLNVSAHDSGADLRKCAEMDDASSQFGSPAVENLVASSRAMPALLTRSWMPLGSFALISSYSRLMSALSLTGFLVFATAL